MLAYTIHAARHRLTAAAGRWLDDTAALLADGWRDTLAVLRQPAECRDLDDDHLYDALCHHLLAVLIGPHRRGIHCRDLYTWMRARAHWAHWTDTDCRAWLDDARIPIRRSVRDAGRVATGVHIDDLDPDLLAVPLPDLLAALPVDPSPAAMTCVDASVGASVGASVDRAYLTDPGEEPSWP